MHVPQVDPHPTAVAVGLIAFPFALGRTVDNGAAVSCLYSNQCLQIIFYLEKSCIRVVSVVAVRNHGGLKLEASAQRHDHLLK